MISILKDIKDALSLAREDPKAVIIEHVSRDNSRLFIKAHMESACLDKWQAVLLNIPEWLQITFQDSSDDEVLPRETARGECCSVTIRMCTQDNAFYLFTPKGWNAFLSDRDLPYQCSAVFLLFCDSHFDSCAFSVSQWVDPPVNAPAISDDDNIRVRHYVKMSSMEAAIPARCTPWVLRKSTEPQDVAFLMWKKASLVNLMLSIVNEADKTDNTVCITLYGKPPKKISLNCSDTDINSFQTLQDVVKWIYLEGDEHEVRHTLLTAELAREWPEGLTFEKGILKRLVPAFESARLLYKAHLRAASKETLKTLGELRKGLMEEVQKISLQTKELSTALWKDVALVLGTIALKYATEQTRLPSKEITYGYIFLGLAVYIACSFIISVTINHKHFRIMKDNREIWRQKLYSFLDEEDYRQLAVNTITASIKAYNIIAAGIGFVVLAIVFLLIYLAIHYGAMAGFIHAISQSNPYKICGYITPWTTLPCP